MSPPGWWGDFTQTLWSPPAVFEFIIASAGLVVALGVLWKAPLIRRPVAFVGHRLFGDPITEWFRRLLSEEATRVIKKELKVPNGGASIPDAMVKLDELASAVASLHATGTMNGERLEEVGHVASEARDYARQTHDKADANLHEFRSVLTPIVGQVTVLWDEAGHEPLPSTEEEQ